MSDQSNKASQAANNERIGVLFVCLGNICRSPLARVIFEDLVEKRGIADRFDIDSCGTGGWHVGAAADARSIEVAARNGLTLLHSARRFRAGADVERFDHLLAMDRQNRDDMLKVGAPVQKVKLIRSFDPELRNADEAMMDVPDPYYGPGDGFERVYEMLVRACGGFLESVRRGLDRHH